MPVEQVPSGYESDLARDGPPAPEGRKQRRSRLTPGMQEYRRTRGKENASRDLRNANMAAKRNMTADLLAIPAPVEGLTQEQQQPPPVTPSPVLTVGFLGAGSSSAAPQQGVTPHYDAGWEEMYAHYGLSSLQNAVSGAPNEFAFASNLAPDSEETPPSVFVDALVEMNGPSLAVSTVSMNLADSHRPSNLVARSAGHLPQGYLVEPLQANNQVVQTGPAAVTASSNPALRDPDLTKHNDNVEDVDGRPKKRARLRQSRSAKDMDEIRRKILLLAYPHIRARVACIDAYPNIADTNIICLDSFTCAFDELKDTGVDTHDIVEEPTVCEMSLLRDRVSQHRSVIREPARAGFDEHYKHFITTLPSDTAKVNANKALYETLIMPHRKPLFLYEVQDERERKYFFRAPIIQTIINKTWFTHARDLGVQQLDFFEAENGGLAPEVIAFAATAARFALDEWKGGFRRAGADALVFGKGAYKPVYNTMIQCLREWEDAAGSIAGPNSVTELRVVMLKNALQSAGVSAEAAEIDSSDGAVDYTAADFGPEDFM